jgi:hypothetical protein
VATLSEFVKPSHFMHKAVTENQHQNACRKVNIRHGARPHAKGKETLATCLPRVFPPLTSFKSITCGMRLAGRVYLELPTAYCRRAMRTHAL